MGYTVFSGAWPCLSGRGDDSFASPISGGIYVTVTDADAHYQRAKAAGAHVLGEPHDVGEGFRGYTATGVQMGIRYNGTVTGKWRRWAAPT